MKGTPHKAPTLKDVARAAGVAVATASYALRNSDKISIETRARVQAAKAALGYEPNRHARQLRRGGSEIVRTDNLGLLLVECRAHDPIYGPMIQRFTEVVQRAERHPLVLSVADAVTSIEELPVTLRERNLDGYLLTGRLDAELVALFRLLDLPFVVLGNYDLPPELPIVRLEIYEGVCRGMARLGELGHRRIGLVSETIDTTYHLDILRGYRAGLQLLGLHERPDYIQAGDQLLAGGEAPTRRLLALQPRPTAILVTDYRVAVDVMRVAMEEHLAVGRDLSILTLAGKHEHHAVPRLARIMDDVDMAVDVGMKILLERLADPAGLTMRASVPCCLAEGETIGAPPNE